MAAGLCPPTQIGGCGRRTGRGSVWTSRNVTVRASNVARSVSRSLATYTLHAPMASNVVGTPVLADAVHAAGAAVAFGSVDVGALAL